MKNLILLKIIKCVISVGIIIAPTIAFAGIFTDVDDNHKFLPSIRFLKESGVIKGYSDGSFKPDSEVNRAEALKIITLSQKILKEKVASADAEMILERDAIESTMNVDATQNVDFDLTDVGSDSWYYKYVFKAFKDKIINGYSNRTFRPGSTIQLSEAIKILFEANNVEVPNVDTLTQNPYKDVYLTDWYAPYIQKAKKLYIIFGDLNGRVYPETNLTRKELANLIYRFYTLKEGRTYGRASYYADYFQGRGTASGEKFDQNSYTGANLSLPFGTLVKVVNIENDKSVIVKINDRGPYDERFVIDLSKIAFETISPLSRGVIQVYYEIIHTP